MFSFKSSSHRRLRLTSGVVDRFFSWGKAALVVFFMIQHLPARDLQARPQDRPDTAAFALYLGSLQKADPFNEGAPVGLLIESSLPHLYKDAQLLAIRNIGENERSAYVILGLAGDGAALDEVTTRYFALQDELENLPLSYTQISPANYKFRFRGEVKTGVGSAYVYDIAPKRHRPGLFRGQIWIDASTGAEVLTSGRFADTGAIASNISFVRETISNGAADARVTHISFEIPLLGRGEVVVTERQLGRQEIETPQGSSTRQSSTLDVPNLELPHL